YTLVPPAPTATASPTSPASNRNPSWTLTDGAVGPVSYVCSASGPAGSTPVAVCGAGSTVSLDLTGQPDGVYTLSVQARDSLGQPGAAPSLSYTLVPPAPAATASPTSPASNRHPSWTLTDGAVGPV